MFRQSRGGLWSVWVVGVVGVAAAVVGGGCDRKPAPPQLPPAAVTVARPAEQEVVDWDEFTGFLAPVETVDLRARVGGFVEKAEFQEGQPIEAGQVLFELDPKPYKAELDKAQGQVQQAQAQAENAVNELARLERLRAGAAGRRRSTRTRSTPSSRRPPPSPRPRPTPRRPG